MINKIYPKLLNQLLEKQVAFAAWFVPHNDCPYLLVGNEQSVDFISDFEELDKKQGFVFAPFAVTEKTPIIILKPGIFLKGYSEINQLQIHQCSTLVTNRIDEDQLMTNREGFLKTIKETISEIKKGSLSKVIISRTIEVEVDTPLSETFVQLRSKYPDTFCYLVNLPYAGTWMGASPELLLQIEENTLQTVSLAGTQQRKIDSDYSWHTKEIEEQAFVSRYLLDVFYKFQIPEYRTEGPITIESGNVAHLKTSFYFPYKKDFPLGEFISQLHPTPAVCGLPKDKAAEFIRAKEKHRRKYYTGFVGPWKLEENLQVFVNLRCMELNMNRFILYVGGGITAQSIPEKEWDETIQKAATLLSVMNRNDID